MVAWGEDTVFMENWETIQWYSFNESVIWAGDIATFELLMFL